MIEEWRILTTNHNMFTKIIKKLVEISSCLSSCSLHLVHSKT